MKTYTPVVGLEIHVELKTKSKMFCQCSADYFGAKPNSNVCPVCLGLPGALPVPNKTAILWMQKMGAALGCELPKHSKFDRKHYSYPDLPKGYQISQYKEPFAINGKLTLVNPYVKGGEKSFGITRVHMEEDTAKLMHEGNDTLVDFNRSSVPLVEIVTEPDFTNADDVKAFLEELQIIVRYLGISDADMEKGSMRLEPNISVRKPGEKGLPNYKVEVKNINSFKFVKAAIEFEVKRQTELLEKGETPKQETRGYDDVHGGTYSQRSKEEAQDYRYFPEPDIPPFNFTGTYIEEVKKSLPELPSTLLTRFVKMHGVKPIDAYILTRDKHTADLFEETLDDQLIVSNKIDAQSVAHIFINKISKKISTYKTAKSIAEEIYSGYKLKSELKSLELPKEVVEKIIVSFPKVVADYKGGKQTAIMFLIGQVMKQMKGKADASTVRKALEDKLKA